MAGTGAAVKKCAARRLINPGAIAQANGAPNHRLKAPFQRPELQPCRAGEFGLKVVLASAGGKLGHRSAELPPGKDCRPAWHRESEAMVGCVRWQPGMAAGGYCTCLKSNFVYRIWKCVTPLVFSNIFDRSPANSALKSIRARVQPVPAIDRISAQVFPGELRLIQMQYVEVGRRAHPCNIGIGHRLPPAVCHGCWALAAGGAAIKLTDFGRNVGERATSARNVAGVFVLQ